MRLQTIALTTLLFSVAVSVQSAPPTWTAISGHQITAEFVALQDGNVLLENGSTTNIIALNLLDGESKARAKQIAASREIRRLKALTPAMKASKIEPLAYTAIPHYLSQIFTSPKIDVYLSEQYGYAEIFVKEDGQHLSEPLRLHLLVRERVGNELKALPVEGEPTMQQVGKDAIRLLRTHQYGVKTELYIRFQNDKISAGFSLDNPHRDEHDASSSLLLNIRPSYYSEQAPGTKTQVYYSPRVEASGVPFEVIEKLMSSWSIKFKLANDVKDVQTSFPYLVGIDSFPKHGLRYLTLSGGIYGNQSIMMYGSGNEAYVSAKIYPGFSPARGYTVSMKKQDQSTSASSAKALFVIEVKP